LRTSKLSLIELISRRPNIQELLQKDNELYSYADIKRFIEKNKIVINKLKASRVALRGTNSLEQALMLCALDGQLGGILLTPVNTDKGLLEEFYKKAVINYEVTLKGDNLYFEHVSDFCSEIDSPTQWIIPTSGTTGVPKLVTHTLFSLMRTVKTNPDKGGQFTWGLIYDINRFAGLQVFLQALLGGSKLVITDTRDTMKDIIVALKSGGCNALSATPSFWRKMLMSGYLENLKLDLITLGGEIADEAILQTLSNRFPNSKVTHIYASTEAGVGFSVTDGLAGFPLDYLNNGIKGGIIKVSKKGTLLFKNQANEQQYLADTPLYDNEGFIDTGDIVKVTGDRVFFLGRDSGTINVGGNKVHPEEVEHIVLSSGYVSAAYVYGLKNPIMGNLVCVDVIVKDDKANKDQIKRDLISYCSSRLDKFKVPAIVKFKDNIEITPTGKLKR